MSDYKYQEKLLYREVEEMKKEKEDDAVTSRVDKCREILAAIGGCELVVQFLLCDGRIATDKLTYTSTQRVPN